MENLNTRTEGKENNLTEGHTKYDTVSVWKVKEVLKSTGCGKARGPDGIVGEQIKLGGTVLWNWIRKLMKGIFSHAVVLDATLETWVKPLVKDKKGNVEDSNNYRGITITSVWSKIVDKLILNKLNNVIESNHAQFGFKRKLSTKMAVQVLVEVGNKFCNKGGSLFCGFVDIKKAFDRVQYKDIWNKMETLKVGKNIINMVKEQYKNQTKRVIWENEVSEQFKVEMGVMQGSSLSPCLFALVLDDVIEEIQSLGIGCRFQNKMLNIIVYADDILVLGPSRHAISEILNTLSKSLKRKGLELNIDKTVAMEIKEERRKVKQKNIEIEGREIKWVGEFKFLGVIIQNDMRWEKHWLLLGNKVNKLGNMILHQCGKVIKEEDRLFLLETCAFDLYGVEFCTKISKKQYTDVERGYHWLIKRALKESKYYGNHQACAEGGMLTWELISGWKVFILWQQIINSNNEILKHIFGQYKWETEMGRKVKGILMQYGKDIDSAKELKKVMLTFVEAMAVLKELERDAKESGEEAERV